MPPGPSASAEGLGGICFWRSESGLGSAKLRWDHGRCARQRIAVGIRYGLGAAEESESVARFRPLYTHTVIEQSGWHFPFSVAFTTTTRSPHDCCGDAMEPTQHPVYKIGTSPTEMPPLEMVIRMYLLSLESLREPAATTWGMPCTAPNNSCLCL